MPDYWYASDLAQYLVQPVVGSQIITGSSNPIDLTKFQEIIDERSAVFDQAAAKAGYAVPIASTASTAGFRVARAVVRDGATADVLRIIYTGPDQKYVDRFQTSFDNALKAIEQGDRPLPGAAVDEAATNRLLPIYGGGNPSAVITATMGYPMDLGIPNDF